MTRETANQNFTHRGLSSLLLTTLLVLPLALPASADTLTQVTAASFPASASPDNLEELLSLPGEELGWPGDQTDENLAYAVTLGNDPALEKRNPFRKKSLDLFRTEHPVVIGRNHMKLRIRVRPKSRETVKLELRF